MRRLWAVIWILLWLSRSTTTLLLSQPLSSSRLFRCTAFDGADGDGYSWSFQCQLAEFGLDTINGGSISARLVVATPLDTCEGASQAAGDEENDDNRDAVTLERSGDVKALLIARGGCGFAHKARIAHDAYGAAVALVANTDDALFPMAGQLASRVAASTIVLMITRTARDRFVNYSKPADATCAGVFVKVEDQANAPAGGGHRPGVLSCAASFLLAVGAHRQHQWGEARQLYRQCVETCPSKSGRWTAALCNLGALDFRFGDVTRAVERWNQAMEPCDGPSAHACLPITVALEHNLEIAAEPRKFPGMQAGRASGPESLHVTRLQKMGATTIGVDVELEAWLLRRRAQIYMHARHDEALRSFQALDLGHVMYHRLRTDEFMCDGTSGSLLLSLPLQERSSDPKPRGVISRALDMACALFLMRKTFHWQFLDLQVQRFTHEVARFVGGASGRAAPQSDDASLSPRRSLSELCGPIIPGMDVPLWVLDRACADKSEEMLESRPSRMDSAVVGRSRNLNVDRRLRVGYISPNLFVKHPVGKQLLPLIALHNRSRFLVHCFCIASMSAANESCDAIDWCEDTVVLALAPSAGSGDPGNEESLAQAIVAYGIQVLVDVSGHTILSVALQIIARAKRAIPVTIHFHDTPTPYASGRGLAAPFIDFFLSDPISTGSIENWKRSSHERLLSVPHEFWVVPRPSTAAEHVRPMQQTTSATRFCNLGRHEKIDPVTLDMWSNVLILQPTSTLLLFGGGDSAGNGQATAPRSRLCGEFEVRGVHCASRVRFHGHVNYDALHSALKTRCDLYLDSPGYNSISLGADSLRAGTPVLTLLGENHHGRMAAAIVRAAGMDTLVTDQVKEYVGVAAQLAGNTSTTRRTSDVLQLLHFKIQMDLVTARMNDTGLAAELSTKSPSIFNAATVARWVERAAFEGSWEAYVSWADLKNHALTKTKRMPHIWCI